MKTSEIRAISRPKLDRPTFILGLSDQYDINDLVAQTLIEHMRSEKFAELYSPHFPDCIVAEETGLCHLPRCDLYASERFEPNTVIMIGYVKPDPEDSQAHYEMFDVALNFALELGCRRFLSFGTFQREGAEEKMYVAATTGNLVSLITRKLGGKSFARGRIDGLTGLVLGLAKVQGLPAICVLGTSGQSSLREDLTQKIFHYLVEVIKLKVE